MVLVLVAGPLSFYLEYHRVDDVPRRRIDWPARRDVLVAAALSAWELTSRLWHRLPLGRRPAPARDGAPLGVAVYPNSPAPAAPWLMDGER